MEELNYDKIFKAFDNGHFSHEVRRHDYEKMMTSVTKVFFKKSFFGVSKSYYIELINTFDEKTDTVIISNICDLFFVANRRRIHHICFQYDSQNPFHEITSKLINDYKTEKLLKEQKRKEETVKYMAELLK